MSLKEKCNEEKYVHDSNIINMAWNNQGGSKTTTFQVKHDIYIPESNPQKAENVCVDNNIPTTSANNKNTFAVIIGNENYNKLSSVDNARNDAYMFAKYCNLTLGIPGSNIRQYNDATYGVMMEALNDITNISKAYNGNLNIIFYF